LGRKIPGILSLKGLIESRKEVVNMKTTTKIMIGIAIIAVTLISAGILAIATKPNNNVPTSTITCSWEPIATPAQMPVATAEPTDPPIE
jgi:hypothetical protein